jgi:hypothetical protein
MTDSHIVETDDKADFELVGDSGGITDSGGTDAVTADHEVKISTVSQVSQVIPTTQLDVPTVISAGSITQISQVSQPSLPKPYYHDEEIAIIRKQIVDKYKDLFAKKIKSIESCVCNFKKYFIKGSLNRLRDVSYYCSFAVEEEAFAWLVNYYQVQYIKYESGKVTFGPSLIADDTSCIRRICSDEEELKKIRDKLTPEYQAKIDNEMEQIASEMEKFMDEFSIGLNDCSYYYYGGSIHDESLPSLARRYKVEYITCNHSEPREGCIKITFGPTIENHIINIRKKSEKEIERLQGLIEQEIEQCEKEVEKVRANKRV